MHLIEVGLEARIGFLALRGSEQLIETRRPEVVHVVAPALDDGLHGGRVRAFGHGRDHQTLTQIDQKNAKLWKLFR